ncbi:uncharacterized protein BX663DRAFT_526144 [Cokeromyces recurvatus]|uniref:uncharacterized protein n=1 Tax=Cokeromyces recurvatus TaxID=90255 RepID=UPI0022203F44|nr:uncharacterized protein BX663DRAFT_526144 [Cokeromyces recurvatus]KAI7898089.1 hypothetical protein BX663DRAFT_526144 [Cokeromyces recurvatus]
MNPTSASGETGTATSIAINSVGDNSFPDGSSLSSSAMVDNFLESQSPVSMVIDSRNSVVSVEEPKSIVAFALEEFRSEMNDIFKTLISARIKSDQKAIDEALKRMEQTKLALKSIEEYHTFEPKRFAKVPIEYCGYQALS